MRIELVLSKTYIHKGKVYNKGFTYEVADALGTYLTDQVTERQVPYFRRVGDHKGPAHEAPAKSVNKGGIPKLVNDEGDAPDAPEVTEEKDKPLTEWQELQKKGRELGVYKHGMGADALRDAIASVEEEDDADDSGDAVTV